MKYTQISPDAFSKLQLNAGILIKSFEPATGSYDRADIFAATGGGISFEATPTYVDFGEDIDNVPANTKELKQLDSVEVKISGTGKTVDTEFAKLLVAAADIDGEKVTPRSVLKTSDFADFWWVGDYSDVNTGGHAGYMAIKIINALSTGGFKIQSNDKGKGDFSFEFTGHYSIEDIDVVPFEVYIKTGEAPDATLSALTLGALTLEPEFDPEVTAYTATTTDATNTITATANDSAATVSIKNGSTAVDSGSAATWETGENTVTVTVVNETATLTYTVVVTKGE